MATDLSIKTSSRALLVPSYGPPSSYTVSTLPTPSLDSSNSHDLLVKVHAAALNPGDIWVANGQFRYVMADKLPLKLGYDVSGVVVALGSQVSGWEVGDAVCALVGQEYRGTVAEYCLIRAEYCARKPAGVSHDDAASLASCGLTVYGALKKLDFLLTSKSGSGLEGKTILIPGGLSGTGAPAVQIAKHFFGCSEVYTTVSPSKIPIIDGLLVPGTITKAFDYTLAASDPSSFQSFVKEWDGFDAILDTRGVSMSLLPYLKPSGVIVSIAQVPPPSSSFKGKFAAPWWMTIPCDIGNWFFEFRARRRGCTYAHFLVGPDGEGLEDVLKMVDEGKVKAVIGGTAKLEEGAEGLGRIQAFSEMMNTGKGGVGKYVVKLVE